MNKVLSRIISRSTPLTLPRYGFLPACQKRYIESGSVRGKHSKVSDLRKYWFSRYLDYIKNYEKTLEKNFPKTMHVYRVFSIGTKDFYFELKKFILIKKKQKLNGIDRLSREELQLCYTMPKDLLQISPVLLISAIPFTNYIIFPLAYFFPRQLLTSHYWSLQQRLDFALEDHKKRLKHNKPLFRCMQAKLQDIEDATLQTKWGNTIAALGSGTHPSKWEIIGCATLFANSPYSLKTLKRKHVKELLAVHGISRWRPYRRRRLLERGLLIKKMDEAIQNEGGVQKIPIEALRWALFFRGLNPVNMSTEAMQSWLQNWLSISSKVDEKSISLLLHLPILLAYNHATNWTLLYH